MNAATLPDRALPSLPVSALPTAPVLSRSRAEGVAWYCSVMSQARCAADDIARFAAGL